MTGNRGEHPHEHEHEHRTSHGHDGVGWWRRALHATRPHGHDAGEAILNAEEASSEGIRAAWISMAGMAATALAQIVIVALSGSIALLADTLHNLGHLVTTIPLVIAFRLGRRQPTKRYPFGYRRAEDLVGLLIAGVIAASAGLIIWESVAALRDPHPLTNLGWVFAAGLVGAAGNETVAIYRIRIGRKIGSAALIAEGNHARADGLTSIAVAIGAVGVWLGFDRADAIIGLVIAGAILWILIDSSRALIRRLMDGVDPTLVDEIERVAGAVPGVESVDEIRARWSGHRLEVQLTLGVDGGLTVAHAHDVTVQTHEILTNTVPHLNAVTIHLHPSDDPRAIAAAHPTSWMQPPEGTDAPAATGE